MRKNSSELKKGITIIRYVEGPCCNQADGGVEKIILVSGNRDVSESAGLRQSEVGTSTGDFELDRLGFVVHVLHVCDAASRKATFE